MWKYVEPPKNEKLVEIRASMLEKESERLEKVIDKWASKGVKPIDDVMASFNLVRSKASHSPPLKNVS